MERKPIDTELVERLYIKHIYKDSQSVKTKWKKVIKEYEDITGDRYSKNGLKKHILGKTDELWKRSRKNLPIEPEGELHYSQRYIEISTERKLTNEEALLAHGFDPEEWDVVSAGSTGSKIGTNANDEQYFINTYKKLKVKPKEFKLTKEVIDELLNKPRETITIERKVSKPNGLLVIPLFDMHFGINTYEDYKWHQAEIYKYINSQEWEEVLFIIGQDLLHNDNLRGHTSNQTLIEQVDVNQAWDDALKFYDPLIQEAISKSLNTKVIYSKGNHDESLSWALVKLLKRDYPQVEFDGNYEQQYKSHVFKNVFIGVTHGDKSNDKKLAQVFNSLYRLPMAQANRRIIFRGHLHTQKTIDEFGTTIMGLGTGAKTDQWHEDNGYVGNNKSFEIFVFNDDSLKGHMFIDGR